MVRKEDFDWHDKKRAWTLGERNIDFRDAIRIFDGFVLEWDSPRDGEHRIAATGIMDGDYLTVVYTWRGGQRRIISARPARRKERQNYERARQDHER